MRQYLYNVGKQLVDISDNGIWGNISVSITGSLMREDLCQHGVLKKKKMILKILILCCEASKEHFNSWEINLI